MKTQSGTSLTGTKPSGFLSGIRQKLGKAVLPFAGAAALAGTFSVSTPAYAAEGPNLDHQIEEVETLTQHVEKINNPSGMESVIDLNSEIPANANQIPFSLGTTELSGDIGDLLIHAARVGYYAGVNGGEKARFGGNSQEIQFHYGFEYGLKQVKESPDHQAVYVNPFYSGSSLNPQNMDWNIKKTTIAWDEGYNAAVKLASTAYQSPKTLAGAYSKVVLATYVKGYQDAESEGDVQFGKYIINHDVIQPIKNNPVATTVGVVGFVSSILSMPGMP